MQLCWHHRYLTCAYLHTLTTNKFTLALGTAVMKVWMLLIVLLMSTGPCSTLTLRASLLLNIQMFPALYKERNTHVEIVKFVSWTYGGSKRPTQAVSHAQSSCPITDDTSWRRSKTHKSTIKHTHSQNNECSDECAKIENSSVTVSGGCLLLVHLPTTVATAATAGQEETNYGHQDDVQDANGNTHQETHFINQSLNTKHTHTNINYN